MDKIERWWRDRHRTSWLSCYVCRHDLNGDDDSFIDEVNNEWRYRCANCGVVSTFSLDGPIPMRVP